MQKEIMGKVKDGPTREQIKEAFQATIARWEKIVEDVDYFEDSYCSLCTLPPPGCLKSCPIKKYTGKKSCIDTPYIKFDCDQTPENALAELNFLRKVYIWWMEKSAIQGEGLLGDRKEKKEEWVDVTEEIDWETDRFKEGCYLIGCYLQQQVVQLDLKNDMALRYSKDPEIDKKYKIERRNGYFRILKKT